MSQFSASPTASPTTHTKQIRLARYYLDKLRQANDSYQQGREGIAYGLRQLEQEWGQIKHWQAWSAGQAADHEDAASLCNVYPRSAARLLEIFLTPQEFRNWLETALAVARQTGDSQAEQSHLLALAKIYEKLDLYVEAADIAHQAVALAQRLDDQETTGEGLLALGLVSHRLGNYAEAQDFYEHSLDIYRVLQRQEGVARSLFGLGMVQRMRGSDNAAQQYFEEVLAIRQEINDSWGISEALNMLAELELSRANASTARQYLEDVLRIRRELNDRQGVAVALSNLGRAALLYRDYATAKVYYEESLAISRQRGSHKAIASNLLNMAGSALLQEDWETACVLSEETLASCRQMGYRVGIVNSLVYLAYAQLGLNQLENAHDSLLEGLNIVHEIGTAFLLTELVMGVALLYMRSGKFEEAAVLTGLVRVHPNVHPVTSNFTIPPVLVQLEKTLGAEMLTRAITYGETLAFDTIVTDLIATGLVLPDLRPE
jgi:tetratricopeptide (TPR) repeat protein